MKVLVTGGAGYIGSHAVVALREAGHTCIVFDNLSTGHADAVRAPLRLGDIRQREDVERVFEEECPDAVMHFAARSLVGESMSNPAGYWGDNILGTLNVLDAMRAAEVRKFVFSSSAAVYGHPPRIPITEQQACVPVNPYGRTKRTIELILDDYASAYGLRYASLRYFNAAGADPGQRLGERHSPETHLIPLVLQTARGLRASVEIYGKDYDTPDGTCIRDYIHVLDLAAAHVLALEALEGAESALLLNLGTGRGHSVQEVIEAARRVTGCQIPAVYRSRRAGDPPILVADPTLAEQTLAWRAKRQDLDDLVGSAWQFMCGLGNDVHKGRS